MTPGSAAWKLLYQVSPIWLEGGIAAGLSVNLGNWGPLGNLGSVSLPIPIALLTEGLNLPVTLLGLGNAPSIGIDSFFANWRPVPGAALIEQEIAKYPFATQMIAANAVIIQPKQISMIMEAPARGPMGYPAKLPIMSLLQGTLYEHNVRGGTYVVATPSFIYFNCLMKAFRDVSTSYAKQVQTTWQMDFEAPLITINQADQQENALFDRLTKQLPPAAPQGLGPTGIGP